MTTRRTFLCWMGGASTLAFGLHSPQLWAKDGREPLALVVAPGSLLSGLSLFELKQLFLGDKIQGPDGNPLMPLNRGASTHERIGFDNTVLGLNPEEAARYWIDRRIRGQSGAPKAIDPGLVLQRIVTRLPGSIGYVALHEVTQQVKVIRVDGKLPDDPGYAVRSNAVTGGAVGQRLGGYQV